MRGMILTATVMLLGLAACSGGDAPLHNLRTVTGGPDDFSVLPNRPLEIPQSLAVLPQPTPGLTNRTDPNPRGDAIAALGGSPAAAFAGGIPASDGALVNAASRFGANPAIRAELAAADAAFRGRIWRGGIFSIFDRDRYFRAYANEALDAYAALRQFRNLGVATPTAPPVAP